MKSLSQIFAGLAAGAICFMGSAQAQIIAVPPMVQVSDLTGTLSDSDKADLGAKVQALEKAKGSQLAVLLVPTTGDEDIEQYAHRVFESWHLGRKGIDDGVLLIIAKKDKHLRIEVGRGLEGAIPDITAKRIGSDVIAPEWKKGNYAVALSVGVDMLAKLITDEPLPKVGAKPAPALTTDGDVALIACLAFGLGGLALLWVFIRNRKATSQGAPTDEGTRPERPRDMAHTALGAALAVRAARAGSSSPPRRRAAESSSSHSRSDDDDSSSSGGGSFGGSDSSGSSSWSGGGGESAGGGASSDL